MFDNLLITYPWVGLALWIPLYCSDYAITVLCAWMCRSGANTHIVFESFELTPYYQKDIASLRRISPRFLFALTISCLGLLVLWMISADLQEDLPPWSWNIYRLVLGALVLMELAVHVRHITNLVLFFYARKSQGVNGQIRYAQWLTYQLSSVQIMGFAVIYFFSFCLTENWFFVGGSLKCCVVAIQHWRLSRKHRAKRDSQVESAGNAEGVGEGG
jgi:hypothetical protein